MNTFKELKSLLKRVNNLPARINSLAERINAVDERMVALEKAGLIYASGHWRQGKYFMLVYPQKQGVRPSPSYIGTDEAKIQKAQEGIARANEYDQLAAQSVQLARQVQEAQYALSTLEHVLTLG